MEIENLIDAIQKIKVQIESIQNEIEKIEHQRQAEKDAIEYEAHKKERLLRSANIMRTAFAYFKQGLTAWEVAEKIKDDFPSVWDAYYFISQEKHAENVRFQYARAYLVATLAKNGMTYSEISKIAGCTRARCSQIVHTFKN